MTEAQEAVDTAIRELDRLRRSIKKGAGAQVRNQEEQAQARATGFAWFRGHRPGVAHELDDEMLEHLDRGYRRLIEAADRASSRTTYSTLLSNLRAELVGIRAELLIPREPRASSSDALPDFSVLVGDPAMQRVLERRWSECVACVAANAPLAATVMMGGLLEGLLLAKVNSQDDKSLVFRAKRAPRDKVGKVARLQAWTLRDYLDVAHELGWISPAARDVGAVLRDYRNYVHPQKELSHGIALSTQDAMIWWEVVKSVARELL